MLFLKSYQFGGLMIGIGLIFLFPFIISFIRKKIRKKQYLNSSLYLIDKMSGEQFEEYLKAHFEQLGYYVQLTPKTADYGVDLICTKYHKGYTDKFVVQAKRYNGKVGISAIQQIIGGMKYYGAEKGYVVTNAHFTSNAIELAKRSNITLWDRNTLREKFKISN